MRLPDDFMRNMRSLLTTEYDDFIASYDKPHISALRCNPAKVCPDALPPLLGEDDCDDSKCRVPWENHGFFYNDLSLNDERKQDCINVISPGKSPFHEAGLFYVQEPSAMLPVSLLDVDDSGLKVLDLCAAPGGKTTQIAACMKGNGLLVSNEIIPSRAKILSENVERMGVSNAVVISADPQDICDRFEGFFDRILVDAPCSGEGMFRKHPNAMEEWSLKNVELCAERQTYILDCAARMLTEGGRLVYSTCTFNDSEDEGSVYSFLERHSEFYLDGDVHRLFPHRDRGEGHFAAVFVKQGGISDVKKPSRLQQPAKGVRRDMYKPFDDFAKEYLTKEGLRHIFGTDDTDKDCGLNGVFVMFGEQLYLAPFKMPDLKGLKVLRPGLHLGLITKGRFEPSHALALYLRREDVKNSYELDFPGRESDVSECYRYLKGESVASADAKGWTLMLVKGYSIGWGKASGNMIKNHYPKGLRL